MKVLIVSQYFWPENFRINDLAVGLMERGHEVVVLTGMPNYPGGKFFPGYGWFKKTPEEYRGVRILRVPLMPRGNGSGMRLALNYFSFALFASVLSPFLCRGKYDLIFVFEPSPITVGLPALVLKKFKAIPILFWVQDLWPESLSATGAVRSPRILHLVEKIVRFIYQGCDRILVTSHAYFSSIQGFGIDSKNLLYFPQSVEELYKPVTVDPRTVEYALMPNGFRVLFAGNIGTAQSFETILDAAERLSAHPTIQWIIVGDGRMRAWVETEVQRRNLTGTVHLLGRHPVESMPRFFALADVLLVTLKKEPIFALTIPGKVQSYLACGKPIIAAMDGEGSRLVREAFAGLTCPAEDPEALADAVLEMFQMPLAQREEMGQCGTRYYAANFARDMLISKLEGWMLEVSNGGTTEV
jgi:glycosyltransferase involved in cell wall biosynthesis